MRRHKVQRGKERDLHKMQNQDIVKIIIPFHILYFTTLIKYDILSRFFCRVLYFS